MINIQALITGIIVGVIFGVFKLPMPAPNTIGAILGVVGIFVGYSVVIHFKG